MFRCEVLIPFHLIATNTIHVPGDIIEVSAEQLAKIQTIRKDMVSVIGETEPAAEPVEEPAAEPKKRKPKQPK